MDVHDKVAIITGSAQGLGRAFAIRLLEAGCRVCLSDANKEKGEKTLKELEERFDSKKVCFVPCDVTQEEEFQDLFDKAEGHFQVGCIDILANNAGINCNYGWRKCMTVNIIGVMIGTEIAMDRMKKAGKPCQIINTASIGKLFINYRSFYRPLFSAGLLTDAGESESMVSYMVSKHGVVALTRSLSSCSSNIQHKAICPSFADTEIVSTGLENENEIGRAKSLQAIKNLGGLMTPEFVAQGFFQLLTEGDNGAVMVAFKDVPYIIMPDYHKFLFFVILALSKLFGKAFSPSMVNGKYLLLSLVFFIHAFFFLMTYLI